MFNAATYTTVTENDDKIHGDAYNEFIILLHRKEFTLLFFN